MKSFFPKIVFLSIFFLNNVSVLMAIDTDLSHADSLFANRKYTEAFQVYEQIFSEGNASNAMLTRMAFIKEGLGNYAEALYFLNLYYKKTSDEAVLSKMQEIAEEHDLQGYEYSDSRFFLSFIRKYQMEILSALLALSLFCGAYSYRLKTRGIKPVSTTIVQFVVVILIGIIINGLLFQSSAIISSDNVVLMSGPSAGSEPVEIISKGHKVEVLNQGPIWDRIRWDDQTVYIRSKNLQVL